MAKKKRIQARPVNLTENRTSQEVRKYVERVRKEFRDNLKASNIPIFMQCATDPDIVAHYFIGRPLYEKMFGNNIQMMDRIFRLSVSNVIVEDIMQMISGMTVGTFPGPWNRFNITSLVLTTVNVATITDDPSIGCIFTVRPMANTEITVEDLENYGEGAVMPFSDYNPNKFYQMFVVAIRTVVGVIQKEIQDNIPAALLYTSDEPLTMRYGREVGTLLKGDINKWNEVDVKGLSMDEQAVKFVDCIEHNLVSWLVILMSESGLSAAAIETALNQSKATIFYKQEFQPEKKVTKLIHPWVNLEYSLGYVDNGPSLNYTASIRVKPIDLVLVCSFNPDEEHTSSEKQSYAYAKNRVGKAVRSFLDDLVKYAININIREASMPHETPDDVPESNPSDETESNAGEGKDAD